MNKLISLAAISLVSGIIAVPWLLILASPILVLGAIPLALLARFKSLSQTEAIPKVLVVDDDESSVSLILALLQKRHADVTYVSTGLEALGRLRSENFNLVVMDYLLPDINGDSILDIQRERRDSANSTRVLFHTSSPKKLGAMINEDFGSYVVKDVIEKGGSISMLRRRLDQELSFVS